VYILEAADLKLCPREHKWAWQVGVRQVTMVTVTYEGRGSCQSPDHRSFKCLCNRKQFPPAGYTQHSIIDPSFI